MPGEEWWPELDEALERSLEELSPEAERSTILLSGGIDSSLLAWELRDRAEVDSITIGTERSDDLARGEEAATLVGIPWSGFVVDRSDLRGLRPRVESEVGSLVEPALSVQLALALAVERTTGRIALCGQGIDELFLGYARYRARSAQELDAESPLDVNRLLQEEWPISKRIAAHLKRELRAPYLTKGFVDVARKIPLDLRLPRVDSKPFFRSWARHRGLPQVLVDRPKRALQYSSGVHRLVKEADRTPIESSPSESTG